METPEQLPEDERNADYDQPGDVTVHTESDREGDEPEKHQDEKQPRE